MGCESIGGALMSNNKLWGFREDLANERLPPDEATLRKWITFSKIAWPDSPCITEHLEDLANKFGSLYTVEFTTVEFWKYCNAYIFGVERDQEKQYWGEGN